MAEAAGKAILEIYNSEVRKAWAIIPQHGSSARMGEGWKGQTSVGGNTPHGAGGEAPPTSAVHSFH